MITNCFNLHFDSPNYEEALTFYRDVIGFPIKQQFGDKRRRGVIFAVNEHTELEFFALADDMPQHRPVPASIRIKCYVDDIDAEYARLTAHNVTIIDPLGERPWGEKSFGVAAPDGLILHICQLLDGA